MKHSLTPPMQEDTTIAQTTTPKQCYLTQREKKNHQPDEGYRDDDPLRKVHTPTPRIPSISNICSCQTPNLIPANFSYLPFHEVDLLCLAPNRSLYTERILAPHSALGSPSKSDILLSLRIRVRCRRRSPVILLTLTFLVVVGSEAVA
jgi:hypothetical protein